MLRHVYFNFRYLIRNLGWRLYSWAENLNNADMETNGEFYFISHLPSSLSGDRFIFFDVGANVGEYSQAILERFPDAEGHIFDPLPSCTEHLHSLFAENNLIHINNVAVSDTDGKRTIWLETPKDRQASFYRIHGHDEATSLDVETITLKSYITAQKISHIHLLKVDVEGHELKVLEGMGEFLSPNFVTFLQFEYGGVGADSGTPLYALYQLLDSKGFVVCKLTPKGLWRRRYYPIMDNFQYANYVAVSPEIISSLSAC